MPEIHRSLFTGTDQILIGFALSEYNREIHFIHHYKSNFKQFTLGSH